MDKLVPFFFIFKNAIVSVGRWIETHSDFISAAATVAIAAFTLTLWWATRRLWKVSQEQSRDMKTSLTIAQEAADSAKESAQVAKDTLTSTQRAFVFLKNIEVKQTRDLSDYSKYIWWIFPRWQNSGNTPTENLTISVGAQIRSDELPDDFPYTYVNEHVSYVRGLPYVSPQKDIPLMIGPKTEIVSEPLTFSAIPRVISFFGEGHVHIYVWGQAEYNDVFVGTPKHRTRFCVKLLFTRQKGETEDQSPLMAFTYYGKYNCADEDCDEQS